MSDLEVQSTQQTAGTGQPDVSSPGALLKKARQSLGVHIEALAVALKVPVSKLEALEADNYAVLPDAVFVRALASSVCRVLKMDPAPVLALMPQSSVPSLAADSAGINAAFKDGCEKGRTGVFVSRTMRPAFLGALALLLGAVVILIFFPHSLPEQALGGGDSAAAPVVGGASASAPIAPAMEPASAVVAVAPSKASVAMPVQAPVPAQEQAAVPPVAATVAASVAETQSPVETGGEILVFRARSESWIQVRDASGATTLQRVVAAGEKVVAQGKPPFAVVVGKADATDVLVRGKVLDLVTVSKDNVARFEVKP